MSSRIDELAPGADTVDVIRMLYYQPSTENTPGYWGEVPLFRVEVDGEDRFIDRTGAYYSDLYDFRRHNEMLAEDGTLIAPKDLSSDAGEVELISTSGRHVTGWEKAEPWVMSGAIVLGVGLTMTGVGAPIGLGMIAGGVGYTTADAVANFRERSAHGQSNSWSNPAARADYLTLVGNALAFTGIGASVRLLNAGRGVMLGTPLWQVPTSRAGSALTTWQASRTASAAAANGGLVGKGLHAARAENIAAVSDTVGFGIFGATAAESTIATVRGWRDMTPAQQGGALGELALSWSMLTLPFALPHVVPLGMKVNLNWLPGRRTANSLANSSHIPGRTEGPATLREPVEPDAATVGGANQEQAHRASVREGEEAHRESVRVREEAHRESVRVREEAHRESVREGEEAHRESVRVREEAHRESVREGEEAHRESVRVREEAHRESLRERDEHGQTIMGEPAERPRTTLGDDGAARNDSDGHAGNTDNPGQLPRAPLGPEGQHAPAPIGRSTGESMSGAGRGDGHGPPPGGLDAAAGDGPPTGRDVDGDLAAPDTTGFRTETKPELGETDLPPPGAQPETNDCARCAATNADEWRAAHGEPSRGPLPDDLTSPDADGDAVVAALENRYGQPFQKATPEQIAQAWPTPRTERSSSGPRPSGRVSVRTCSTRSSRTARSATSTGGVSFPPTTRTSRASRPSNKSTVATPSRSVRASARRCRHSSEPAARGRTTTSPRRPRAAVGYRGPSKPASMHGTPPTRSCVTSLGPGRKPAARVGRRTSSRLGRPSGRWRRSRSASRGPGGRDPESS